MVSITNVVVIIEVAAARVVANVGAAKILENHYFTG